MKYEQEMKSKPHVVILGAGASCAAIPNGDKNSRYISAMNGFMKKLGLDSLLTDITLNTSSDNLEDIYMELDERSKSDTNCLQIKCKIKRLIQKHLSNMNSRIYRQFMIFSY
jgi:hypothetical protein